MSALKVLVCLRKGFDHLWRCLVHLCMLESLVRYVPVCLTVMHSGHASKVGSVSGCSSSSAAVCVSAAPTRLLLS